MDEPDAAQVQRSVAVVNSVDGLTLNADDLPPIRYSSESEIEEVLSQNLEGGILNDLQTVGVLGQVEAPENACGVIGLFADSEVHVRRDLEPSLEEVVLTHELAHAAFMDYRTDISGSQTRHLFVDELVATLTDSLIISQDGDSAALMDGCESEEWLSSEPQARFAIARVREIVNILVEAVIREVPDGDERRNIISWLIENPPTSFGHALSPDWELGLVNEDESWRDADLDVAVASAFFSSFVSQPAATYIEDSYRGDTLRHADGRLSWTICLEEQISGSWLAEIEDPEPEIQIRPDSSDQKCLVVSWETDE